jgi:hypothetical protein
VNFARVWSMPAADTFDVPPIGEMVRRYLRQSTVSVDPFARNKRWATYTNDLNPDTAAEYHMDAVDFLQTLHAKGICADLVILDPPYSMHQQTVTYKQTKMFALTPVYELSAELLTVGGVALCFGFNSNGLGRERGFVVEELYLIAHGGHHNDTICMAERKLAHQPALFQVQPHLPPPQVLG